MPETVTKKAWTKLTLADCCKEIGQRVENPAESGYERFVGLEHLETGETSIRNWGSTEDVTSSMKIFGTGDVIVARRNVYLRRAARAGFDGVCSGDGIVLRANADVCLPELLPFLLNTEAFWSYVTSQADGTMSKRITVKRLMSYEFALPPLEEQRRIAEVLHQAEGFTEKLALLQESTVCAFSSAASLRFSLLRDNYPTVRLAEICLRKPQSGIYKPEQYRGRGVPIVNMGELFGNDIVDAEIEMERVELDETELQRYTLTPNDLLFGRRSVVLEGAGRCVLVRDPGDSMVFESSILRATIDPKKADTRFVFEWLRSPLGHQQIRRIVTFTTVSGVAGSDVARLPVPLPPLEVQERIADELSGLREQLGVPRERTEESKELSKTILRRVLEEA